MGLGVKRRLGWRWEGAIVGGVEVEGVRTEQWHTHSRIRAGVRMLWFLALETSCGQCEDMQPVDAGMGTPK